MKKKSIAYNICIVILAMIGLCACYELDKDYSTASGLRLDFSTDTLTFDTVFTSIGSTTRQLMIYNKNSNALLIQSIRLENANVAVGFRLNVDGRSGNSFSDVRIAGHDSLYVFIEVTARPTDNDLPVLIEDRLEFAVNNSSQYVVLQAYGQDAVMLKGGKFISSDTVWTADRPYLIYDSIVVDSGARLKIEPGAVLYMHDKAKWIINGSLTAVGELDRPIVFRGDRLDYALDGILYDRMPGLWDAVYFRDGSFDNELDYAVIKNGGRGIVCHESTPDKPKIRISNSQITNMSQSVFEAVNCNVEIVNTELSNTAGAVLSLTGGYAELIHCTLVNFSRFSNRLGNPALQLSNYVEDKGNKRGIEFTNASFANCIIDGSFSEGNKPLGGEIGINQMDEVGFNFVFNNCAIKTMETPDKCFNAVRFVNSDFAPKYKQIADAQNGYAYDFRPVINKDRTGNPLDKQPVVGQADTTVAALHPYDRIGIARTGNGKTADIGAYEHVNEEETE